MGERTDGRRKDEVRRVKIIPHFLRYPEGSALIELGDTKVICTASVSEGVPSFLAETGEGWITSEYSMLPRATQNRTSHDAIRAKGRSHEIQRMIGRSLRAVVDLTALGPHTIFIDCDVIQADGGTRTASITGGFVALAFALNRMAEEGIIETIPIKDYLAAISVGIIDEGLILDLNYEEDSRALVDLNVVMTGRGNLVEIQGTAEGRSFSFPELEEMINLAKKGVSELIELEKRILGEIVPR